MKKATSRLFILATLLFAPVHLAHAQKIREGYRLEGGPGHWRWLKPDGTDVDARPPPPPRSQPDDGRARSRSHRRASVTPRSRASRGSSGDAHDVRADVDRSREPSRGFR